MANYGPAPIDFSGLNQGIAALGQGIAAYRRRSRLSELGKSLTGENPDYGAAAQGFFDEGDSDTALKILTYRDTLKKQGLTESATRDLIGAIGGGGGSPAPAPAASAPAGYRLLGELGSPQPSLVANESGGRWDAQNDATGAGGMKGHFGRLQFGHARLQEAAAAGAIPQGTTPQAFMASPEIQKSAEGWHFNDIDQSIKQNGFDQLVGKVAIGGVPVTVEGLRAVAHLGGKEGMRKFVESNGAYNPADANGTRLSDYFARHGGGGQRMQVAQGNPNLPAPGASQAAIEGNGGGFSVPGQPSMSGRTFDAITAGEPPLQPVFQSEGAGQPWMGSALQRQPQQPQQVARTMPPQRPYDLGSDLPAPGAVPAVGQMPQAMPPDLSNANDAGAKAFAMSQGANAPNPLAAAFQTPAVAPTSSPVGRSPAPALGQGVARSDLPAPGAVPTQGQVAPPRLSSEMPRPTNAQEYREVVTTRQMEGKKGQVGKLAAALANPNLPANARAVGEIFLKEALEQSKAPDSVKEFLYARSMGWTTAKSPNEYAKEKQGNDTTPSIKEYEYAKRSGFTGSLLDFEREKAASKAKPGPSAADQKAIFAAEDELPVIDGTIETLKRARELNGQTYTGAGAGIRGQIGTSGVWGAGLITDEKKAAATREFGQIMSFEAIKSMSALLKGATTEREMSEFQRLLGDPSTPPELRARTIDRMLTLAERQKGIAQGRIEELRSKAGIQPQGQSRQQAAPQGQRQPDASQARQAPDGNFYVPDPNRPGKYLQVNP
jgi:hypothetical protein